MSTELDRPIDMETDTNHLVLPAPVVSGPVYPWGLTPREARMLDLVSEGWTNKEIGRLMMLSPQTVKNALVLVYRRMGIDQARFSARVVAAVRWDQWRRGHP